MESVTWEGCERMLAPLNDAQRLALFMSRVRAGVVDEHQLAVAAAAVGMSWVSDPPMPKREGDLVTWGAKCLRVLLTVAPWHEVVPDLYRHLDDVGASYVVTEDEVEATAGNSEGGTAAPSATA
tara:strand:+ start:630 stop:1001 length:372 start_codon:yes stop_codon:yes gene_type:complete